MKYFLGLSSNYSVGDVLRHTFAFGDEYQLPELRAFLAAHYGATFDHVAVYANGRTALSVAVKSVAARGSKVVITSLTCYAVVQAVKAAGCIPVFADVNKDTLHFGAKELEKALQGESNVKAVIVQNNLGIPVNIEEIERVAKLHKLEIIEDLAHCAGVKYPDGREVGTVGRVAALSFGKGKSIDVVSGGAVVFTNPLDTPIKQPIIPPAHKENLRARFYPLFSAMIRGLYYLHPKAGKLFTAYLLKTHQIKRSADGVVDTKTRLTYWQCKLALRQLRSMPHRGRKPIRDFYLVNNRDEVLAGLEKKGYYFRDTWYDMPVAPKRYFKKADFHPEQCPIATDLAKHIVNLPTWYDSAHLRSAKRLIMAHLVENPDEDAEHAEVPEEEMTDDEKKAKIKAEKAARNKELKASKKAEKKAKKAKIKKLKEDGAPDEAVEREEKEKKSVKATKEKIASALKDAKKKATEKAKEKKAEKAAKRTADFSALEEKSNILETKEELADEVDEEIDEDAAVLAEEKVIVEPVEDTSKNVTDKETALKPEKTPLVKPEQTSVKKQAILRTTKPHSDTQKESLSGMRVAPKKLSEREKLKQELEAGKKEKPSVL